MTDVLLVRETAVLRVIVSGVPGGEEAAGTQWNRARGITRDKSPIPEDVIGSGVPEGQVEAGTESNEPVE